MLDGIIQDNLEIIIESIALIEERFSRVGTPDRFVSTPAGMLLLDAISMRLQVIGEVVKKIDKIEPSLFMKYSEVEWDKIMKLRDIISHHYHKVDHEIIFDICQNHIPQLKLIIRGILRKEDSDAPEIEG
ncbi:MAG: DUF86 domain-containing protein [Deltaproteobacteria bacterium]|nr:DUF86 domain-containing protein [Deltaproteobacteria bacterium]